ncbi:BTB/POZ domain-containing protein At1g04390 [Magnolia sinica]|uniref:BTB/POZ domain-containing protein At1g04390 n=1 Tax=Magnolia sinica TaxID=86752 RepID=UPI00265A4530|nr:BTB/POZ domain-containing protein At1g04390 [Magnolia sinica]
MKNRWIVMKSSKIGGSEKNRGLTDHVLRLHQRLSNALSLGIKYYDNKERRWQCTDVEIQGLAVRTMTAFISCISSDMSQHPLVEDSITDMLVALEGILQSGNENVLSMAVNATTKLVELLGNSLLQRHVLELVRPLSRLLSLRRSSITVSCAIALNRILSKLTPLRLEKYKEVWEVVEETNAVGSIVRCLQDYVNGIQPVEHFTEMASLLRTILWRWPPSRYLVWSNSELMEGLGDACAKPDSAVATAVLKLYSALALCGNGAMKLIQNGEKLLPMIVHCMGSSQPRHIRMEAFTLSQHLMRSSKGCSELSGKCYEPIVRGIINAMNDWRSPCSEKVPPDLVPLVVEACCSALFTCWAREHHSYFWKLGIDRILLDLLVNNFSKIDQSPACGPLEELIAARKGLYAHGLPVIRPYIWDILGLLATNCGEDFDPTIYGNRRHLNGLIACACSVAADSIRGGPHSSEKDFPTTSEREPACRAVSLMVYSPCKYIASQTRHFLSFALMPNGNEYLENMLATLKSAAIGDTFAASDNSRLVISLMSFTFYLSLPQFQNLIVEGEAVKTLSSFIRVWVGSDMRVRRTSIAPHLHNTSSVRKCCLFNMEDWEGGDVVLFFSLRALSKLIQHFDFKFNHQVITSQHIGIVELVDSQDGNLVVWLKELCNNSTLSPGPRWYAAYSLSFFGFYGFQSKLGKRVEKALNENELADLQLVLSDGQSIRVHSIILKFRCPSLLPLLPMEKASLDGSNEQQDIKQLCRKFQREVRLSPRVDNCALMKLLEFVYTGILWADDGLVKQLRMLAKRCNLQSLSDILYRKQPKWGAGITGFDFTPALGPAGYPFSDIILEAKETGAMLWTCSVCLLSAPHVHAHKIILWSSCDYLQALFQSGMQESRSQNLKIPLCWEALAKLVSWFYSGELPKPSQDCLWNNMDMEQQLCELQAYIELSSLSEFWFLEDVRKESIDVVLSCLKSNHQLCLKIIQFAATLAQQEIVEAAVSYIAPLYPRMRDSGDLEVLDEELRDVVRVAYVRFCQEGHQRTD